MDILYVSNHQYVPSHNISNLQPTCGYENEVTKVGPTVTKYIFFLKSVSRTENEVCYMCVLGYNDRYVNKPKLITSTGGDEFFMVDDSRFYFDELKGPKYLRYTFYLSSLISIELRSCSCHSFLFYILK